MLFVLIVEIRSVESVVEEVENCSVLIFENPCGSPLIVENSRSVDLLRMISV